MTGSGACRRCGSYLTARQNDGTGQHVTCPEVRSYDEYRARRAAEHPKLEALHDHLREHGEATASDMERLGLASVPEAADGHATAGVRRRPCRGRGCRSTTTNTDGVCDSCVGRGEA